MSDMVPEVLNAALDSLFTPKEPGEQEYQGEDGLLYCRNCHTPVQCRVKLWGRDKIVPCLCRCQQEAMAEKKRQDELVERQASPSLSQAQRLKKLSQEGGCTLDAMCEVMNEIKKDELDHVTIKNEVLRKYFPKSYTPKQMQDTIIRLLEKWQRSKQRDMER